MRIDIAPFCGKDDVRAYINDPFNSLGGTGATDGRILVWLAGENFGKRLSKPEAIERVLARAQADALDPDAQWIAVETIRTSSRKCKQCDGTGVVRIMDCEDCDGDGSFYHGGHEYDCKECDGAGSKNATGIGDQCDECEGSGKSEIAQPSSYAIGNHTVASNYITMMRKLPGCKIKRHADHRDGATFVFDGGIGVVMPLIKEPIGGGE